MDRVGFYLTGAQPVERVLPLIARAAKRAGQRMLVVSDSAEHIDALDKALWEECAGDVLAHGKAGEPHSDRQPLLLADACTAENGASLVAFADGKWREEAERFERVFVFFGDEGREAARAIWRQFDQREDIAREYHALEAGKWVQKT